MASWVCQHGLRTMSHYWRWYHIFRSLYCMKNRYWSIIIIIVTISILLLLSTMFDEALTAMHLSPRKEGFTELYFTSPMSLPEYFTVGRPQSVAFTVHNVEYREESYYYTIVAGTYQGSSSKLLASGSFTLRQGHYQHELASVLVPPLGDRVKVTVTLTTVNSTGRRPSIAYWVTRVSP